MATGIKISNLPEHLDNIEATDWLPFVDSSGSKTKKVSPKNLFDNISAVKTSNWILKEKLEFDNEVVDGSSVSIKGNNIDRIMIITEMSNAASKTNMVLRLNNDTTSNYTRLCHYGGDSHGGYKQTFNQINLGACDSGGTGIGRYYLYPKVTGSRRVCEGDRSYIRNNSKDIIQNDSTFWGNTVEEITSLDFNSNNIAITGKISIYEWKDLQVTDLHTYELIDEINIDNEILNKSISIKGNQEDEIKIVTEMFNANGEAYIYLLLNNDATSNYTRLYHHGGDTHGGGNLIYNQIKVGACDSGGTGVGRYYLYPKVNGTRRVCEGQRSYIRNSYGDTIYNESYFWENTVDEITSLDFNSQGIAITGKIRIYKIAKSHIINQQNLPGMISSYSSLNVPLGWLACDGSELSRTAYSDLYKVIGTTFGEGDGSETFNIPDLRGEFIRGYDNGKGVDVNREFGSSQEDTFQGHWHKLGAINGKDGYTRSFINLLPGTENDNLERPNNDGTDRGAMDRAVDAVADLINGEPRTSNETRPRNVALNYIIKY